MDRTRNGLTTAMEMGNDSDGKGRGIEGVGAVLLLTYCTNGARRNGARNWTVAKAMTI